MKRRKTGYVICRKHLRNVMRLAIKKAKGRGREICGVIVSNGHFLHLVRTRNRAKGPGSFQLPAGEVRKIQRTARKLNLRVLGTFHSHPVSEAEPGVSDIAGADDGALMLILSCWDKEAKLWKIRKRKAAEVPLECVER